MTPAAVLSVIVTANTAQASASLAKLEGQMKGVAATSATSGSRVARMGSTLTKGVTLPLVALGAVAVKSSLDFQKSMMLIQTQAGATHQEVENLSKAVLDFAASGQTEAGPQELAKALYAVESAGIHGARAMATLKASSDLSMLSQSDLTSTTKALVAAQKTGIKGSQNLSQEIGTLNAVVGAGQMHMDDLVAAMGTGFLAAAKQMGISLSEVGAGLDELTKQGMPAASAATRLRMALSQMATISTRQGASSAIESIGIGADKLATVMRTKGLVPALELLRTHLDGLSKVQQTDILSTVFGGARSGTAIMMLVNNLDDLSKTLQSVHQHARDVNKSLADAKADPAVQLHIAWAQVQADFVKIGNVLVPIVVPAILAVASGVTHLVTIFGDLPHGLQSAIVYVGLFAAAVGPVILILGSFSKALIAIRDAAAVLGLVQATEEMAAVGTAATAAGAAASTSAAQLTLFGTAAEESAGGMALLSTSVLGPIGIVVAAAAATYGMDKLMGAIFHTSSATADMHKATTKLSSTLQPMAQSVNEADAAQRKLNRSTKEISSMQAAGVPNWKRFNHVIQEQSDALYTLLAFRNRIKTLENTQTGSLADQRSAIKKQQDVVNAHQALAGQGAFPKDQLAQDYSKLIGMTNQYRVSVINALRSQEGMTTKIDSAFNHVFGTFQKNFGQKLAIRVGLIQDPAIGTRIASLSNQLNYLTGGGAKKWVLKILADKTSTPDQKIKDLQGKLDKISKHYGIDLKTTGLDQAKQSISGLTNDLGKVNTQNAQKQWDSWKQKVQTSVASAKQAVQNGQGAISGLMSKEIQLFGGNVTVGGGSPKNAQGGFAGKVPGHGSGDKVLMQSWVEPGEGVFVLNRTAMGGLEKLNRDVPRNAQGGQASAIAGLPGSLPTFSSSDVMEARTVKAALNGESAALNPIYQKRLKPAQMIQFGESHATGPYKWGGGHSNFNGPYDCSGYVSAILHSGGLLASPETTDGLKNFGLPGPGAIVTVGVRGSTGRNAHTMMEIGNKFFESGGTAGGASVVGGWDGAFPIKRHPPGLQQGGVVDFITNQKDIPKELFDPSSPYFVGWGLQKGGWARVGATYEGLDGHLGSSGQRVGGVNFAELLVADANAGKWHQDLAATLGLPNRAGQGMPDGTRLYFRKPGSSHTVAATKNDIGSGQSSTHYKVDAQTGLLRALGLSLGTHDLLVSTSAAGGATATATATGKGAKTATTGLTNAMIKQLPMSKASQGALQEALKNQQTLSDQADIYADFAQRAQDLGIKIAGLSDTDYLYKQLGELTKLRNKLVAAHNLLVAAIEKMNEQIAHLRKAGGKGAASKIASIKKLQAAATQTLGSVQTSLTDVQGNVADPSLTYKQMADVQSAPLGTWGGKIGDVIKTLHTAGADSAVTSNTDAINSLLLQENTRLITALSVSQEQYPVLSQIPAILGSFASGGVAAQSGMYLVGEKGPELVNLPGGSQVIPNGGDGTVSGRSVRPPSVTAAPAARVILEDRRTSVVTADEVVQIDHATTVRNVSRRRRRLHP